MENIAIFGALGAIGAAFTRKLAALYPDAHIHAFARNREDFAAQSAAFAARNVSYQGLDLDAGKERAIAEAVAVAAAKSPLDMVIVATGFLHGHGMMPEKSLRDLSEQNLSYIYTINTILPALIAKYALPVLRKDRRAVFAALSARVGSISDNRLGGWYGYRASKAALNMIIKNAAIETGRRNQQAIIVGLHPGTVASGLSAPFQKSVAPSALFAPEFSAEKLLHVLQQLKPDDSGKCFDWDGKEIAP